MNWLRNVMKVAKPVGLGLVILGTVIEAVADVPEFVDAIDEVKKPELPGPKSV